VRQDNAAFSEANARRTKDIRFVIAIDWDGGTTVDRFTSHDDISGVPGTPIDDVVRGVSVLSQRIQPDKAVNSIGSLSFELIDAAEAITDLFRTRLSNLDGLYGRTCSVYVGYSDLSFSDFVLFQTQVVEEAEYQDGTYSVQCRDRQRETRSDILSPVTTTLLQSITESSTTLYLADTTDLEAVTHTASFSDETSGAWLYLRLSTGEIVKVAAADIGSGQVDNVERGALNTIPMEIEVDTGLGADRRPKVEEYIYIELPGPQMALALMTGAYGGNTLPAHWHLGIDPSYVATTDFSSLGDDLWDGSTGGRILRFEGLKKISGKRFIEGEIYQLLGLIPIIYADGTIGVKRQNVVLANAPYQALLDSRNVTRVSGLKHDMTAIINRVSVLWNWNGEDYTRETFFADQESAAIHQPQPVRELKFKGLHGSRHTVAIVTDLIHNVVDRWSGPPLRCSVDVHHLFNVIEPGDIVRLRIDELRDFSNTSQSSGGIDRSFEVQQVTVDHITGRVTLELFGSSRLSTFEAPTDATSVLPTGSYSPGGATDISTLTGYQTSPARLTSAITLTGNADMGNAGSIFYHDGDLQIDADITIEENVQLRIDGYLTINQSVSGVGNGPVGEDSSTFTNDLTGWNSYYASRNAANPGYFGTTQNDGGIDVVTAITYPARSFEAHDGGYEEITQVPLFNIDVDSSTGGITGLPSDLRGIAGSAGGFGKEDSTYQRGGDGGNGGAGLLIICKGLGFGASGNIDLGGGDGSAGTKFGSYDIWSGAGGGGAPGALLVLLDGAGVSVPQILGNFQAVQGSNPRSGTPMSAPTVVNDYVTEIQGNQPAGTRSYFDGQSAEDFTQSAYRVQYLVEDVTPEEDDPYDPTQPQVVEWTTYHDNGILSPPSTPTGDGTTGGWQRDPSLLAGVPNWFSIKSSISVTSGVWGTPALIGGEGDINAASIIFRQADPPASPEEGWIWIDTDDTFVYRYNGATWDPVAALDALILTNGPAESGADVTGNNADDMVFRQSSAPSSPNVGWVWIDTDDLNVYRYNGTSWDLLTSLDALLLNNAPAESGADVTENNADRIIFYQSSAPTSPQDGWLWVDTDNDNVFQRRSGVWQFIGSADALNLTNAPAEAGADVTSNNADTIIFAQSAPPSAQEGYIWIDTDDSLVYRYNGATWDEITALDALLLTNAAAEAGADVTGNNANDIIFRQSSAPGSPQTGWIWVDTDDSLVYRYNGATWDEISALDALLLTNAPSEAGADVTQNNADTIVYSQSAPPGTPQQGWIWVDTDDSLVYRHNGSVWEEITALDALLLTNAAAEAGADVTGNNADDVIFAQGTAPVSPQTGWVWVDTDDSQVYRYNGVSWDAITALDALLLTNAPAEAGADVTASNADTIIFYQSGQPGSAQTGWLWVDTDNDNVYRYNGASWDFIGSGDALNLTNGPSESGADVTSNNAQNIIFRQSTEPGSAQIGWIWVDTDDSLVYRYNGATWDEITALDALLLTNAPAEAGADVTASNSQDIIFRQSTAPVGAYEGWIWVDTDDSRVYRFNGSTWDQITALDALELTNAPAEAGADQTANQASTIIYRQASAPSSPQTGWIWVDTDDSLVYRYNGSTWDEISALDALLLTNGPAEADADVTGAHPSESFNEELVLDRDMELTGLDYWHGAGSLTKSATNPAFGSQSLQVTNVVSGGNADVYQAKKGTSSDQLIAVEPGQRLFFSGWVYTTAGASYADIGVRTFDASESPITWLVACTNSLTSTWQYISGELVIPSGTYFVVLWLRGRVGAAGTTRWDRVSMRKTSVGADVTGDQITGFQSLLPNWNFEVSDGAGRPAAIWPAEGINDLSQIAYGDIGIEISTSPDASVAYGFPAIPIDDNKQYIVTVRHRSSGADADGLYLRFNEIGGYLVTGKTHIGNGVSWPTTQDRDSFKDLVANGPMPGTTTTEDSYTYTPTPGTRYASLCFYNWDGSAVDYYVERVNMVPRFNAAASIFYQSAAPSSPRAGWLWIDTDDSVVYRYNGSTWSQIGANDLAEIGGLLVANQLASQMVFTQDLVISTGGHLRSGQSAYNTGVGYFLEYNGGFPRLSMRAASGQELQLDSANDVLDISQLDAGSFSANIYGVNSSPVSRTVYYRREGRLVTLYVTSAVHLQSNSGLFYLTGIPSELIPTTAQTEVGGTYENNNYSFNIASARVSGNRIDFYRHYASANELQDVLWTGGSNYKGFTSNWTFRYFLD
jgi:hypothetical protein